MPDVGVVVTGVLHPAPAHRAPRAVVVHAPVLPGAHRAPVQPEPLHPRRIVIPGKAGHQGVVGVEYEGSLREDGGLDGVIHPLRMPVPGELIPVQVGDDEVGGVEPPEGELGVPLVALQQEHVPPHPAPQGAAGQNQGGHPLDLVGALLVVHHLPPVLFQDLRNHLHGGGLAVGPGDGDDMGGQPHPAQHVGAQLQGVLPRQGAALAHQPPHKPQDLAHHNGQK